MSENTLQTPAETPTPPAPPATESTTTANPAFGAESPKAPGGESLLSANDPEAPKTPEGAPETYADFTAPEGITLDKEAIAKYGATFKELGLTQDGAQKLVDAVAQREADIIKAGNDAWIAMNEKWAGEVKAEYGVRLPEVRATLGRAIDACGLTEPQKLEFREAMTQTGAGNHPAFVRMIYALSKKIVDGRPTPAGGPVDQQRPNGAAPRTFADAMYPRQ